MRRFLAFVLFVASLSWMVACGGDDVSGYFGAPTDAGLDATTGGGNDGAVPPSVDASSEAGTPGDGGGGEGGATTRVHLGGTVAGLSGTGLSLRNGAETLPIAASGAFTFATPIATGATYAVTVADEPSLPTQSCLVTNGSGTAGTTDITTVIVICAVAQLHVDVTVAGLTGTGLVLENDGSDDLGVTGDGTVAFAAAVDSGNMYNVTVKTQPDTQTCSVNGGVGRVGSADVTGITVQCGAIGTYALGGQYSGLNGTLVLQNDAGDNLTLTGTSGTFAFPTTVAPGSLYNVTVLTQPASPSQTCTVTAGVGVTTAAPTTSIRVTCVTNAYPVTVDVTGLAGTGLVLQDNDGDNLAITASGAFTFAKLVASGTMYSVTVLTPPSSPAQVCTFTGASGIMGTGQPTNVQLSCTTTAYTIYASVTGLTNTTLTLQDDPADDVTVAANGKVAFATKLTTGSMYDVSIAGQQGPQACSVAGGSGKVGTQDVTVVVNCQTNSYAVSGTITGLSGSVVLQDDGGGDTTFSGTSFAFPAAANGSAYAITVLTQPTSPSQVCTVARGSGTLNGAAVTDVAITCATNVYTVGGTVTGLAGTGLALFDNGSDRLAITGNGTFVFKTPLASGVAYAVTVAAFPTGPTQSCTMTNANGAVGASNVTNVVVACTTSTYAVGGSVSGLVGSGLYLQDNSADTYAALGNGTFTFNDRVASGGSYSVVIAQQPSSPTQTCVFKDAQGNTIANPTGPVTSADITSLLVSCTTNSYSVGGTVTGLATGAMLSVQDNGVDTTVIGANGPFHLDTKVASGASYAVTVPGPPTTPPQTCAVSSGSGTVGSADVTSVAINCSTTAPTTYTVGGTLSGLNGGAVVLQDDNGDDLTVAANGSFSFAKPVADGTMYSVTVLVQPTNPTQVCTLANDGMGNPTGSGTVNGANVTAVLVTCTTTRYNVTTTVHGLVGGTTVVLQDNGADNLTFTQAAGDTADITQSFATMVASGDLYDVTTLTNPTGPTQTCTVSAGTGIVRSADVAISVTCTVVGYTVGGTVKLDSGGSFILTNNSGADYVTVNANGSFTFPKLVASGGAYAVSVGGAPDGQNCIALSGGSGTVTTGNVTNVVVECSVMGQMVYDGDEMFNVPAGVTSVSVLAVGQGGTGGVYGGGAGGTLCYATFAATPGGAFAVKVESEETEFNGMVASAGQPGSNDMNHKMGGPGGSSFTAAGGVVCFGGGGGGTSLAGFTGTAGGGGAGGYTGAGGTGADATSACPMASAGTGGGGGGGGSMYPGCAALAAPGGYGGGGVGVLGPGSSGVANGGGGSGGGAGVVGGGSAGGGGASPGLSGGPGAIRIIWGAHRAYPSTNTQDM